MKRTATIAARLRADLRLTMVMMFGTLTVLVIAPFLVVRLLEHRWLAAALDAVMMLVIALSMAYVWRTGRTVLIGTIDAAVVSVASAVMAWSLGEAGHYWIFAVLVANFMLAPRMIAIACSLLLLSVHMAVGEFSGPVAAAAFLASALLVGVFAAVFVGLTRRQHRQLMALATLDPLTGLPNRRAMESELPEILRQHQARHEPAALAMLDLDYFKRINDCHGHDIGDQVLIELATRVQGVLRKRDRLFRLGGEEFMVLLPGTDAGGARAALEKVRREVERLPMSSRQVRVTISVGVALQEQGEGWPAWMARADEAMYEAKRRGRNQVRLYPPALMLGERRERRPGHATDARRTTRIA